MRSLAAVLGTKPGRKRSKDELSERIGPRFFPAMSAYTRSLAADVDEKDEASCKRFFDAVAPIDVHRSTYTSDSEDEEDVTPEPTPTLA